MTSQSKKGGRSGPYAPMLMPDMPDRVQDVVGELYRTVRTTRCNCTTVGGTVQSDCVHVEFDISIVD
jgi:hypothetical protein